MSRSRSRKPSRKTRNVANTDQCANEPDGKHLESSNPEIDRNHSDPSERNLDTSSSSVRWPAWGRAVASAIILFHLLAVLMAPLTMLIPAPALTVPIRNFCAPYQQATYLDHGYQFFAPDPGPSHFVQYIIVTENGERIEGRFPDRDKHWPRLHYHRWFMLSERVYAINDQILSAEEMKTVLQDLDRQITEARRNGNSEATRFFSEQKDRLLAEDILLKEQSDRLTLAIRDDLARRYDIRDIELYLVERVLPAPYQVTTEKKQLDDPEFLPLERRIKLEIPLQKPKADVEEIR